MGEGFVGSLGEGSRHLGKEEIVLLTDDDDDDDSLEPRATGDRSNSRK